MPLVAVNTVVLKALEYSEGSGPRWTSQGMLQRDSHFGIGRTESHTADHL
jgi:hypothetical protein